MKYNQVFPGYETENNVEFHVLSSHCGFVELKDSFSDIKRDFTF